MERRLEPLEAAIDQADLVALAKLLHSIKGSALTFGATRLADAARRGDEACRGGAAQPAVDWARAVHQLMPPTTRAILTVQHITREPGSA
jgi:HPt (histidine-containing phosphotransfer) domain-containing protein